MQTRRRILSVLGVAASVAAGATAAEAATAAEFYRGKTVTYIVATAPGGGYDFYGRLIAEAMQRHMPGTTFVVRNVPGAGHIIGANQLYASRPDGLTIGMFNTGLIYAQLIGQSGVRFDLGRMSWIGKAASDPRVLLLSANAPFKSFEDLRASKSPIRVAIGGVGSAAYAETMMVAHMFNLNVQIIPGHEGNEAEMAMRRGEIHVNLGALSSFESFVRNGFGRLALQIGGKADAGVPQAASLAQTPEAKAMVALISAQSEVSRLTAGPPDIPRERLDHLIDAFRRAVGDADFKAKAEKAGRPVEPAFGDDVAGIVRRALDQTPATLALLGQMLNLPPPAAAKAQAVRVAVADQGRVVSFAGANGATVEVKPSGSRTRITIAGKDARRDDLRSGMTCDVEWRPDNQEPSVIACK